MRPQDLLPELHRPGEYCDLLVKCGRYTFHLHKDVVFMQAPGLTNELPGELVQPGMQEITFERHLLGEVKAMIDHIYLDHYDVGECQEFANSAPSDDGSSESMDLLADNGPIKFHVWVFALAERYEIPGLKNLAAWNLKEMLRKATATTIVQIFTIVGDEATSDELPQRLLRYAIRKMADLNEVTAHHRAERIPWSCFLRLFNFCLDNERRAAVADIYEDQTMSVEDASESDESEAEPEFEPMDSD